MTLYTSLFPESRIVAIERYGSEGSDAEGSVKSGMISLSGQQLYCSDKTPNSKFGFTAATSLLVACESAEEIERLAEGLGQDGELLGKVEDLPSGLKFVFLIDRFGVYWQLARA
jgi:predicted 3-demethylubiquinone-9 3-methyltransferase (glyoxalase superfamily)